MACVDETRRYRGQKDAGSSTALRLTGLGETVVLALLALICLAFWAAPSSAKTHAADPSPQQAPAAQSPGTPSPDPAPQADARSTPSHTSAPTRPSIHVTTSTPSSRSASSQPLSSSVVQTRTVSAPPALRTPSPARAQTHHVRAARKPASRVTGLSFPVALPRDLLPSLHAGVPVHRNGVLLLLSAVAMAVVAVASFTLLRRLRRLEAA
jgi:hypothetical protein